MTLMNDSVLFLARHITKKARTPASITIGARVTPPVHKKLTELAEGAGVPISTLAKTVLTEFASGALVRKEGEQ